MPTLITGAPFSDGNPVFFDRQRVIPDKKQLLVWLTLTNGEKADADKHKVFPGVIQDSYQGRFLITHTQARTWTNLDISTAKLEHDNLNRNKPPRYPCFAGRLWLHPVQPPALDNLDGRRTAFAKAIPLIIAPGPFVAIHDPIPARITQDPYYKDMKPAPKKDGEERPELPILGMRLLQGNNLRLFVDAEKEEFFLVKYPTTFKIEEPRVP